MQERLKFHERVKNRLAEYDYRSPGYYFLTTCTNGKRWILRQREPAASTPTQGLRTMPPLSMLGRAAEHFIEEIPKHYPTVRVDKFVVMPNHVHLILALEGTVEENPTVSRVMWGWEQAMTRAVNRSVWEKSFHDHIIRNEADYQRIWSYIDGNPEKWLDDCYYTG